MGIGSLSSGTSGRAESPSFARRPCSGSHREGDVVVTLFVASNSLAAISNLASRSNSPGARPACSRMDSS